MKHQSLRKLALITIESMREILNIPKTIKIKLIISSKVDVWGYCDLVEDNSYIICVAREHDSKRDFVSTVCHEMVHVWQWHTNSWEGDGEDEARNLEYVFADMIIPCKKIKHV